MQFGAGEDRGRPRSFYAKLTRDLLGEPRPVLVHHSFNVTISTACLALLYLLVLWISNERRLAAPA